MITNQYEQMKWNAKYFVSPNRWRAALTPWRMAQAPSDAYGLAGAYVAAINTGGNVIGSYSGAARRLRPWNSFTELPGAQGDHAKAQFATVEMADSAATGAMDIVGRVRANAQAVENSIGQLESDSLYQDANLNTEVAVLNKINAALIVELRNQQDANKLLVALAENRIVETKRARDAEAAAIESDVAYRAGGRTIPEGLNAGTNSAMEEVRSAPRSPWQRACVERLIATIRRECLDHVIVFNEASLHRHVKSFLAYYHASRMHLSLSQGSA